MLVFGDVNFPPLRERPPLPPADARQRPPRCTVRQACSRTSSLAPPFPHCHLLVRDHPWFEFDSQRSRLPHATGSPARCSHAHRCALAGAHGAGRGLAAMHRPSQCRPAAGEINWRGRGIEDGATVPQASTCTMGRAGGMRCCRVRGSLEEASSGVEGRDLAATNTSLGNTITHTEMSEFSEFRMSELLALSSRVGFRQKFSDPFLIPRMTERLRAACSEGPRRAAECSAAGLAATMSRSLPARQRSRASRFSRACSSSASRACPA